MSTKSKLALVATLATLIAAPAFAIDQQASDEARNQVNALSGAYGSAQTAPRAVHAWHPVQSQGNVQIDFQATGKN